jgi:hypothetical protein
MPMIAATMSPLISQQPTFAAVSPNGDRRLITNRPA